MDNNINSIYDNTEYKKLPKNKKRIALIALVVIIALIATMISGIFIGVGIYNVGRAGKEMVQDMPYLVKAYELLKQNYYKDISWEEFQFYVVNGMLGSLGDYCFLSTKDEVEAQIKTIGLQVSPTLYNEYFVSRVKANSPAESARAKENNSTTLQRGDEIFAINGNRVRGVSRSVYAQYLSGDKITLTVIKQESGDKVTFEGIDKAVVTEIYSGYENIDEKSGYIYYSEFNPNSVSDLARSVADFIDSKRSNLVLDLRGNGGGSVSVLSQIAPFFIKDDNQSSTNLFLMELAGNNVTTSARIEKLDYIDANGKSSIIEAKYIGNTVPNFKLTVLTNSGSASASEALLGAINYYKSGVHIGSKTHGKGVAQGVYDFSTDYEILITLANYYINVWEGNVSKRITIHGVGIAPSVENTIENELYFNKLLNDPAVKKSLEYFG